MVSQDSSVEDGQAGHSRNDANRWAPASWREQNTAVKSFQSLREPDSAKRLVRPPEPQGTEKLDQDAHRSFALAHSDDLFFSGLKQKSEPADHLQATHQEPPVSNDRSHGTLLSLRLSQAHTEMEGSEHADAIGSALAQWDDPPDFKPTASVRSNAKAAQESSDFVQWDEPAGPDDGVPKGKTVQITERIRPRPGINARHTAEVDTRDGAGLAQWDDPPDFKAAGTTQQDPAGSESSKDESWHEVGETDYDAAPSGWSQVDDDGPPSGLSSSVVPGEAAIKGTASKQKLADEQDEQYHARAPNAKDDYDAAPLSWSQVNDEGAPPGLPRADEVYEHNISVSRIVRFGGHESAADTSSAYDAAPVNWSQVDDDDGPPPELLLRSAQQASAQEAEHRVSGTDVDLGTEAIDASRPRDITTQPLVTEDTAQQWQTASLRDRDAVIVEGPDRNKRSSKPDAVTSSPQGTAENTTSAPSSPSEPTRGSRPPSKGDSSSAVQSPPGSPISSKRYSGGRKEHKEGFFRKLSTRLRK